MAFTPILMQHPKNGLQDTADSEGEYYKMLWDGWAIVGSAPAPRKQTPAYADDLAALPELRAAFPSFWKTGTAYVLGDRVTNPDGQIVTAVSNHTAGASYNPAMWSVPAIGSSGGNGFIPRVFGILAASLAAAAVGPVPVVFFGDSVTEGYSTTIGARAWVPTLVARLQRKYPSGRGIESAVQASQSATFTRVTDTGIHGYNAGQASTTAATYIGSGEVDRVAALKPMVIFHAVGTNDYRGNRTPAAYKADILTQLNALDAALPYPVIHILVHYGEPVHGSTPAYPWSDYGTAMAELAAARPNRVAYLDMAPAWSAVVPSFNDTADLYNTDNYHPNDRGHALIADLAFRFVEAPIGGVAVPTIPADPPLTNTSAPAITGTPNTGQTLTVSPGTWSPVPDALTYQWNRAGTPISGATSSTYTLVTADEGKLITCTVTATKAGYQEGTAVSNAVTGAGSDGTPALSNTAAPTISGSPVVGQTLTVSNGTWSQTPDSYTYTWSRNGSVISGATSSTYTLVSADAGATITATVTAIKSGYTNGVATTTPTAGVAGSAITETWTGANGASWPAGWTTSGGTATIQNNKGRLDPTQFVHTAFLSGATAFAGNFDETVTFKVSGNTAGCTVVVGVAESVSGTSLRGVNSYTAQMVIKADATFDSVSIYRGSTYLNARFTPVTPGSDGFKVRFKRDGATLMIKVWAAGAAEPASWLYTLTDDAPLTNSYKPFLAAGETTASATVTDFDDFVLAA